MPIDWTEDRGLGMIEALGLRDKEVISLIGAGGKTSLMLRLANELASQDKSVIITTTTRLGFAQAENANSFVVEEDLSTALQRLSSRCTPGKIVAVGRGIDVEGNLVGVPIEWVNKFSMLPEVSHIIIEADWARGQSVTVNGFQEHRVPSCSSRLISLAGVDVVGKALTVENVSRPDAIAELTGCALGTPFTPKAVAQLLVHLCSDVKLMPKKCCCCTVLNKVEGDEAEANAREVAHHLFDMGMTKVILASCQSKQSIIDILEPLAVH